MIGLRTLTGGGQTASDIASFVATFLSAAQRTLDIALYELALSPSTAQPVVDAVHGAAARGVAVRLVYDVEHDRPIPVPPPPGTEESNVQAFGCPSKAISGVPDLMHQKYVVRDGTSVLTGSTNWTDDSWTREENVIVTVDVAAVARAYARDFEDLWARGRVAGTGELTMEPVDGVRAWFCPGRGEAISQRIAEAVGRARARVRVCSPVITQGQILRSLEEACGRVDVAGTFDATQMDEVFGQWRHDHYAGWKIPVFEAVAGGGRFAGKRSTPWGPGRLHDYMHAKLVVADDTVFVGSYNLSGSGERNAENVLEAEDGRLAAELASFVDAVRARYAPVGGSR